jgi:hypothetical protein
VRRILSVAVLIAAHRSKWRKDNIYHGRSTRNGPFVTLLIIIYTLGVFVARRHYAARHLA